MSTCDLYSYHYEMNTKYTYSYYFNLISNGVNNHNVYKINIILITQLSKIL